LAKFSQHQLRPGTPDSVRCPRLVKRQLDALGKRERQRGYNSPDCPASQRARGQRSAAQSASNAWLTATAGWAHRTVSGAPTDPEGQRSAAPDMEGDRAPDRYNSCPVVHRTVRCTTRQKARNAFQVDLQWLLAALGL
jgi:hypothetical protein